MIDGLVRSWWLFALRGFAAMLFGAILLASPQIGLASLVVLFGVFAATHGFLTAGAAFARRVGEPWWGPLLVGAFFGVLAGAIAFAAPRMDIVILVLVFAGWAVANGMADIVASLRVRSVVAHEWTLLASGLVTLVLGVGLSMVPVLESVALASWLGAWGLAVGLLMLGFGLRLRFFGREHPAAA